VKIAITGASGRVGGFFVEHFQRRGCEVIPFTREQLDLSTPNLEGNLDPSWDVLLNPAAIASPDVCEKDSDIAHRVNTLAPASLAAWTAKHGVRFIHFSTDYVFSGDGEGKRSANETPSARTVYGISKHQGEIAVLAANPKAIIARISWIYGAAKPGFVDSVIARLLHGETVEAINDKFSLPTRMEELAGWIKSLLESPAQGIVHACHRGEPVSWYGIAKEIATVLGQDMERKIIAQTLAEQSTFLAERPIHTAMDCCSLEQWIGPVSDWKISLREFVQQVIAAKESYSPRSEVEREQVAARL
jgi:dTDP-4-dehydrorhamnose reductase